MFSIRVCVLLLFATQAAALLSFQHQSNNRQYSISTTNNSPTGSIKALRKDPNRSRLVIFASNENNESLEQESTSINTNKNKDTRRKFLSNLAAISTTAIASSIPLLSPATATAAAAATIEQFTTTAATITTAATAIASPAFSKELSWPLGKIAFSLLPLAGTSSRRATVQQTIVEDNIWTHDQIQGVVNVNVPVRQTVIRLSPEAGGGLLVYNPVAATPQLLQMMSDLESKYDTKVKHLILGTVALEHKATFGDFANHYKDATVWLQPGQWSFPLNVTPEFLGVTQRGPRLREIPSVQTTTSNGSIDSISGIANNVNSISRQYRYYARKNPIPEWATDFDWETLGPLQFKSVGAFSETAMFHKPSKTLLVTDTVVSVTKDPPAIIQEDPRAMLFHARDSIEDLVQDTPAMRSKGWRRMVQFGLVFFPSQIDVVPASKAISQALKIDKGMKPLGEGAVPFSLYP